MHVAPSVAPNFCVCITESRQRMGLGGESVEFIAWPKFAYCAWYGFRSSIVRVSALKLHFGAPARPFLVVTTTTPFAAFVPYSVAAEGPFTISTSSISSGLRLLSRLIGVWPAEFAPCEVM